ncbi:hypothetical protein FHS31_000463 [Sphingomonas vulcanisoli]|uniref:Ice-binding protein C-terminal domain-containing protein n=1 Tax=Sphingomonas vulcanisoli TaxID=1658060 RepID=A0ABX0TTF1_9SPHN|nr:PEPxxWA-CTERM sorting domain-containing protein [Sphingomonas vulcanisoli]NIJ06881.1 hypothetical protein [Sphingomonas vulcanisoli]
MRKLSAILAGLLLLAAMPASAATYLFSYGFYGSGQPNGTYASGTITTDGPGYFDAGSENVSAISGTRGGDSITGLTDFFDADGDQEVYANRPAAVVDDLGLTFTVGDRTYDITSPSAGSGGGPNGSYYEFSYLTADGSDGQGNYISFFTLTPASAASVPEASTWAMMLIGFGAIGVGLRQRRQSLAIAFNR